MTMIGQGIALNMIREEDSDHYDEITENYEKLNLNPKILVSLAG